MNKFHCISFCIMFLLMGCTSYKPQSHVALSSSVLYQLQTIPANVETTQQQQLVQFKHGDIEQEFLVNLEIKQNQLTIVAMSIEGIPLFSLQYGPDKQLIKEEYVAIKSFPFDSILADLQLSLLPKEIVQQGLINGVLKQAKNKRTIHSPQGKVIEILYFEQNIQINHLERNYKLFITKLD